MTELLLVLGKLVGTVYVVGALLILVGEVLRVRREIRRSVHARLAIERVAEVHISEIAGQVDPLPEAGDPCLN